MKSREHSATKVLLFNQEHGVADLRDKEWFPDLSQINTRLVREHGFVDPARHLDYLMEAAIIVQGFSAIRIDGRFVIVPSDLTPFKSVVAKYQRAMSKIDELAEVLFELRSDATADILLTFFDPQRDISMTSKQLVQTMRVLAQIESYEGKVGNRLAPDWLREFCVLSQAFWHETKGGGTRIIFHKARQTKITSWVEDVFVSLTNELSITTPLSRLQGVARDIPAYRPPDTPITGDTG